MDSQQNQEITENLAKNIILNINDLLDPNNIVPEDPKRLQAYNLLKIFLKNNIYKTKDIKDASIQETLFDLMHLSNLVGPEKPDLFLHCLENQNYLSKIKEDSINYLRTKLKKHKKSLKDKNLDHAAGKSKYKDINTYLMNQLHNTFLQKTLLNCLFDPQIQGTTESQKKQIIDQKEEFQKRVYSVKYDKNRYYSIWNSYIDEFKRDIITEKTMFRNLIKIITKDLNFQQNGSKNSAVSSNRLLAIFTIFKMYPSQGNNKIENIDQCYKHLFKKKPSDHFTEIYQEVIQNNRSVEDIQKSLNILKKASLLEKKLWNQDQNNQQPQQVKVNQEKDQEHLGLISLIPSNNKQNNQNQEEDEEEEEEDKVYYDPEPQPKKKHQRQFLSYTQAMSIENVNFDYQSNQQYEPNQQNYDLSNIQGLLQNIQQQQSETPIDKNDFYDKFNKDTVFTHDSLFQQNTSFHNLTNNSLNTDNSEQNEIQYNFNEIISNFNNNEDEQKNEVPFQFIQNLFEDFQ